VGASPDQSGNWYYDWVTAVGDDGRLNTGCYAVAMALHSYAKYGNPKRPVWPSAETLAHKGKFKRRETVQRHLARLTNLGYLKTCSWDDHVGLWKEYRQGRPGADKRVRPRLLTIPQQVSPEETFA
jgi:hypothetical protein